MLLILTVVLVTSAAEPSRSALSEDKTWNKTSSQILCKENQEYLHDNFCCKNCEAGKEMQNNKLPNVPVLGVDPMCSYFLSPIRSQDFIRGTFKKSFRLVLLFGFV